MLIVERDALLSDAALFVIRLKEVGDSKRGFNHRCSMIDLDRWLVVFEVAKNYQSSKVVYAALLAWVFA
jgi:hypothetical protein